MFNPLNPDGIAPPARHYIHSMSVPSGYRIVALSGQVGTLPDGTIPDGVEAQTEAAWSNVVACLEAQGMGVGNIVKVVQYLIDPRWRDAHMAIRDRFLGDHKPTSTLLFISALAQPEMLVEVDVWAAGPE